MICFAWQVRSCSFEINNDSRYYSGIALQDLVAIFAAEVERIQRDNIYNYSFRRHLITDVSGNDGVCTDIGDFC